MSLQCAGCGLLQGKDAYRWTGVYATSNPQEPKSGEVFPLCPDCTAELGVGETIVLLRNKRPYMMVKE